MEADPYAWLEDLESRETIEFIERRNERLRRLLGSLPERILPAVRRFLGVPYPLHYRATARGVYLLVRDWEGYHVILLYGDGEARRLASSRELGRDVVITGVYAEPGGRVFGYTYSIAGSDRGFLRVVDAETLEVIDEVSGYIYDAVWASPGEYYYVRGYRGERAPDGVEPPAWRVFKRSVGGGEELVFGEGLPTNWIVELRDPGGDRVFAVVWKSWTSSMVYTGPRGDPAGWRLALDGGDYKAVPVGFIDDTPYIALYDSRGFGRILRVRGGSVEEVIAERPGEPLDSDGLAASSGLVYATYLVNASSIVRVYSSDGRLLAEYKPRKPSTITMLQPRPGGGVYMLETGFHKPPELLSLEGGRVGVVYRGSEPLDLEVEEDWCESSDGTRIHLFITRKPGSKPRKAIVYGYGGFGVPVTPFYLGAMAMALEMGYAFVVANLRGGGEFGEEWHRAGMREGKQNVFNDYRAALEYARGRGWRTVAWGASNGGLLVAAAITQYPELIDAALVGYPLTDMLRYHKLYLGRLWVSEYGDPEDPGDREYLLKYSPYHNVRRGVRYPPTLIYTGLHDDRVHPAHALKFTAKLEEAGAPVYLRVETRSGHRGASPEAKAREYADLIAFMEVALESMWEEGS